ncbi:energy-coupling factor transporter ATPase [Clostridium sp. 'deep sea']|uniref:energy-coupling factor transporter ATPase n=1 Tax=Clostridium sp. 'deep sea' TaxID=2779445 RepID=UPI0018969D70|nr:energy-coupling factor transporter ATPase [Clostridium sp. 'deep sea']QOR34606.1 energy-coupling factor transporter ATPase [Clostridium sp. 'deep sea']
MSNLIIECKNINFKYDKEEQNKVLNNINLTINEGEFVCIVGANGSGKSTLAKMFNALLLPDSGEVNVVGYKTSDEANTQKIRQKVGMVFQNPDNQIVATIVEEDVAFGPENLGIPPLEIRERVNESLKTVGMYNYRMHAPHLLSGGQKQRIAIAGVLAITPQVIILDEATAMLDPNGRKEVMETIKQLHKEKNITVILITHHMDEVVNADRVLVMSGGEIQIDDNPVNVFSLGRKLKNYGLDLPQIASLAVSLKENGLNINTGILTIEEMVNALCQLN